MRTTEPVELGHQFDVVPLPLRGQAAILQCGEHGVEGLGTAAAPAQLRVRQECDGGTAPIDPHESAVAPHMFARFDQAAVGNRTFSSPFEAGMELLPRELRGERTCAGAYCVLVVAREPFRDPASIEAQGRMQQMTQLVGERPIGLKVFDRPAFVDEKVNRITTAALHLRPGHGLATMANRDHQYLEAGYREAPGYTRDGMAAPFLSRSGLQ